MHVWVVTGEIRRLFAGTCGDTVIWKGGGAPDRDLRGCWGRGIVMAWDVNGVYTVLVGRKTIPMILHLLSTYKDLLLRYMRACCDRMIISGMSGAKREWTSLKLFLGHLFPLRRRREGKPMQSDETDTRFDMELRMRALAQLQAGRSVADVASELEVPATTLKRWLTNGETFGLEGEESLLDTPEQMELRRLRLENEYLRQQRDLYRKACGMLPVEFPGPSRRK